jgi:hypothetical protein
MDFDEFKSGPARGIFAGLGGEWPEVLSRSESFEHLRSAVINRNAHPRKIGCFATAVRRHAGICSSGELRVLLAICLVCDFGHLADELAGGRAWEDITMGCGPRERATIAACVEHAR